MDNSENFEIQLVLVNSFGEFFGKKAIVTNEQYNNIVLISKSFYNGGGFELTCEDETFLIFPPEIVKKSILKINKNKIKDV